MARSTFAPTGDAEADGLLQQNPMALLLGMLLDQQISIELAFIGPLRLQKRLGEELTAEAIARRPLEEVASTFAEKPALHRFPASMAKRAHALASYIVDEFEGEAGKIWKRSRNAERLHDRISSLPGFGEEKTMILMAILGKRMGVCPSGWEEFAGPFADDQPRSAADIFDEASHTAVREWKTAQRKAGRSKQD